MSSREYWGPPSRRVPSWEEHYDMSPPPYDDPYGSNHYRDLPPPQRPPQYYDDHSWYPEERHQYPPLPPVKRPSTRGSFRGQGRGRGKAQNIAGRGQGYSRSNSFEQRNNGPKPSAQNDSVNKSNAPSRNNDSSGKPGWLTQTGNKNQTSTSNSSSDAKPAWLAQSVSPAKTDASDSTDCKPAWLKQSVSQATSNTSNASENMPAWLTTSDSTDCKPAWLKQSVSQATSNTSNASENMPAWLTTSDSTDCKPAWLKQSVSQATSNTSNASANMPAWLTTSVDKPNNQQTVTKAKTQATSTFIATTTHSQSPPPPPPPSHPPPKNQPKIFPVPVPSPSTQVLARPTNLTKQTNKAKSKALVEVKVAAPGEANFISFKNSLQEFSQKKGYHVPAYHTFKNSYGNSARVEVANKKFQSTGIQKDKKEAEQNAAYEALKALGLLAPTVPFTSIAKAGTKRPQPTLQSVAKKLKVEIPAFSSTNNAPNFKCQLNEFCQKFHLPVPTYETVHENGGFVTTLIYNKKAYLSTSPQSTKKAAEQNVAQLVLSKVNQAPPPLDQNQKMILQNFVASSSVKPEPSSGADVVKTDVPNTQAIAVSSVQDLAAKNITPVISYKNKLQEVFQKRKTLLPIYETVKEGYLYNCKVAIDGQVFNASGCKTKKGAEQSAARVALQALGLLDY